MPWVPLLAGWSALELVVSWVKGLEQELDWKSAHQWVPLLVRWLANVCFRICRQYNQYCTCIGLPVLVLCHCRRHPRSEQFLGFFEVTQDVTQQTWLLE